MTEDKSGSLIEAWITYYGILEPDEYTHLQTWFRLSLDPYREGTTRYVFTDLQNHSQVWTIELLDYLHDRPGREAMTYTKTLIWE